LSVNKDKGLQRHKVFFFVVHHDIRATGQELSYFGTIPQLLLIGLLISDNCCDFKGSEATTIRSTETAQRIRTTGSTMTT